LAASFPVQTEEASSSQKRLAEIERQHSNCGDELSQVKDELMNNFKTQQSQHAKAVAAFESELRDLKVKVYDLTSENVRSCDHCRFLRFHCDKFDVILMNRGG
jgi:chromosome segregation ATPase